MVTVKSLVSTQVSSNNGLLAKLGIGNSLKRFMSATKPSSCRSTRSSRTRQGLTMLLKDITMFDQLYDKNLEYS